MREAHTNIADPLHRNQRFSAQTEVAPEMLPHWPMNTAYLQPPLVRIGLIVVVLSGLVTTGLNLSQLKHKITNLQANLAAQISARQAAEAALTRTEQKLATTLTAVAQNRATLETVSPEKEQPSRRQAAKPLARNSLAN